MGSRLPEPSATTILRVACGIIALVVTVVILAKRSQRHNLDAFPTVGSSTWLGSWWSALKYLTNAQSVIQEGYEKHKSTPFKVAELYHWTVILSDRKYLEELAKTADDEFSFSEAIDDEIRIRQTLGHEIFDNPYYIATIRAQLPRNIHAIYPAIRDEMLTSFDEILELRGQEWKIIPLQNTIEKIICRTSNRLFVGLPLCRDPDWIDLNIKYTVDAIKGGVIVGLFPTFLAKMATHLFTNIPGNIARAVRLLGPTIAERMKYLSEHRAEWDEMPNDLLSWLMEQAEGPELAIERLTSRILVVNFAAIHSTSNTFTQALFYLASNPQYIQPLRKEVESIVEEDGWSKIALSKMRKIDSFLKECQRIEGINIVTLSRKALKDFTFSDGTFIPKGTRLVAATLSLHHDASFYQDPDEFKPFRFANMREKEGMSEKYQFASTTTEYLPFGYGRHACPGRFFAADELKSMLAHTVVTYDLKLEDGAACPTSWRMGTFIAADPRAKIMLRNRLV